MNPDRLLTESLRAAPWGAAVSRIMAAALEAAEPAEAVRRAVRREGDALLAGGQYYDLANFDRVLLVGAGKAGAPMAAAVAALLGDKLSDGVVVVKDAVNAAPPSGNYKLLPGGHPVPDARSLAGAQAVADLLADCGPRDLVIVLISGGGSALLTMPAPGVGLDDLQELTVQLLACGARIDEINTLRKQLDQLKGGKLARLAQPATLLSLILSDVVGSPLDSIASGPTVPDSGSFVAACNILDHYLIGEQIPAPILAHLQRGLAGEIPENPRPDDPCFAHAQAILIGGNAQAAEAAVAAARAEGLHTLLLSTYLQGEAREVGRVLAAVLRELAASGRPIPRPACIVAGGETTVTLRGDGRGGRNQELVLAAVADLAGLPDVALVALATDGGDGPTDAAGAVVTGESLERARRLRLRPEAYLARNDAYPFFAALGDLLRPGPTHTNVNDLTFLFAW